LRTLIIVLVAIALVAGGVAVYLQSTTPSEPAGVRFPLTPEHRDLIATVPLDAEAFALIPTAAAVYTKLESNPVTRDVIARWREENQPPPPWIFGRGDLVVWKSGDRTRFALRLDPLRAGLFRIYRLLSGRDALINPAQTSGRSVELIDGLPSGDALVVQREEQRGAYPPIPRPAFSLVQIGTDDVVVVSRAATTSDPTAAPRRPRFAHGALLTASFASPPRIAGDLNRLFGSRISAALEHGGSITIYEIDTGTLLPSPKGVIALPPTIDARDAAQRLAPVAQVRETPDAVLISFDRTSLEKYAADEFTDAPWPASEWAMRIDAARMLPILERLSEKQTLRLVTPRIHRSVRDLRGWIGALSGARTIDATLTRTAGAEELRVRVSSK
jgi:hypothetical protein